MKEKNLDCCVAENLPQSVRSIINRVSNNSERKALELLEAIHIISDATQMSIDEVAQNLEVVNGYYVEPSLDLFEELSKLFKVERRHNDKTSSLKRQIKHCKNTFEKKKLQKDLNSLYVQKKVNKKHRESE